MDTTTINYGIAKLDSMINATMPKVYEFSSDFAEYLMLKSTVLCFVFMILLLVSILIFFISLKKLKSIPENENCDSVWWAYQTFTVVLAAAFVVCVVKYGIDLILLNYNPEMFIFNNYIIQ